MILSKKQIQLFNDIISPNIPEISVLGSTQSGKTYDICHEMIQYARVVNEYEKEQGLSKVNKELIEVNQQLAEQKGDKSFSIRKLEAYQTKMLNKRDFKAKFVKTTVVKSGQVYDRLLKAKDFVKSLPYMFKSAEKLDEYMSEQVQRTR